MSWVPVLCRLDQEAGREEGRCSESEAGNQ